MFCVRCLLVSLEVHKSVVNKRKLFLETTMLVECLLNEYRNNISVQTRGKVVISDKVCNRIDLVSIQTPTFTYTGEFKKNFLCKITKISLIELDMNGRYM